MGDLLLAHVGGRATLTLAGSGIQITGTIESLTAGSLSGMLGGDSRSVNLTLDDSSTGAVAVAQIASALWL